MKLTNARLSFEPHRGDGAVCVYFKDRTEALGFAEAILQEVRNIENDNLAVSECTLITIEFAQALPPLHEAFSKDRDVFIAVPDHN